MNKQGPSRPSGSFALNVTRIASGTVFGQALGILLAPILTRIFAPEAFGILAAFYSLTGIASSVACLRYELAIVLPDTQEKAANVFIASLFVCLVMSSLTGVLVLLGKQFICRTLGIPGLAPYLLFVPVAVFMTGVSGSLNYWNSRNKHFGRLGLSSVVGAISTQAVKLSFGCAGFVGGGTLIIATIAGYAASTIYNAQRVWRDSFSPLKVSLRESKLVENLYRYRDFPILNTWSILLNQSAHHVPIWILAYSFSPAILGYFSLVVSMLGMPVGLLGMAISQVFFQRAAEVRNDKDKLRNFVEDVFKRLVSIGVFPFLLIAVVGQDVFAFAFGQRWAEAGLYSQILSFWFLFQFISSPISMLVNVIEKQLFFVGFNVVLLISRVLSLVAGGLSGSVWLGLSLYSLTGVMCYGFLASRLVLSSGVTIGHLAKYLFSGFLLSMIFILPAAIVKCIFETSAILVLGVSLVSTVLYFITIMKRDQTLENSFRSVLTAVRFGSL